MNQIKATKILKQNLSNLQEATKAIRDEPNIKIVNENFQRAPREDKVKKQLVFTTNENKAVIGVKRNNYVKKEGFEDSSSVASNYTD